MEGAVRKLEEDDGGDAEGTLEDESLAEADAGNVQDFSKLVGAMRQRL